MSLCYFSSLFALCVIVYELTHDLFAIIGIRARLEFLSSTEYEVEIFDRRSSFNLMEHQDEIVIGVIRGMEGFEEVFPEKMKESKMVSPEERALSEIFVTIKYSVLRKIAEENFTAT
ncbi:hypothetical protein HAX54_017506 [Datura stramonium]|uniref:Uncharacterized protein n=1 Tax=Datura stramonium TaxID=4076 RepID=A0ABS8S180_DATST|nr:hypothetical protein [Datura stramonium]